jgi:hypothetical protein
MNCVFDHLVVFADTLEQGAAWCERTLGVTPGPGGRHPQMGTHNRLLRLATDDGALAYLEIIALDPQAKPPAHPRWFGLDDANLQHAVAQAPRLVHAVLRTPNIDLIREGMVNLGLPAPPLQDMQRDSANGPVRWRLLTPSAESRVPTLIEWPDAHPMAAWASSGVVLRDAACAAPNPQIQQLLNLRGARWSDQADAPLVQARLSGRHGEVLLASA